MIIPDYPVLAKATELKEALQSGACAVLEAPPGAGKSTLIPLILSLEKWHSDKTMILLQPREAAAAAITSRLRQLSEGDISIGLITRKNHDVPSDASVIVMTEGVFLRRLIEKPDQKDTSLIIFDEFHERSLNADLALALTRQCCDLLNENLKILIMSATLDSEALVNSFPDGLPVIISEGRHYLVETFYSPVPPGRYLPEWTGRVCLNYLDETTGDLLVFLPGEGEIRKVQSILSGKTAKESVEIHTLYARLDAGSRKKALLPSAEGRKKIILSTNIAETSLTIEGVTAVIDSGLRKSLHYHDDSGLTRLETGMISRASAIQRRGRAGRQKPGICIRLWAETETLRSHDEPQVLSLELSRLILTLAAWGDSDTESYDWIDSPHRQRTDEACTLLQSIEALNGAGSITKQGRLMEKMPLSPRLARLVLLAAGKRFEKELLLTAALLENGDPFFPRDRDYFGADLMPRIQALLRNDSSLNKGLVKQIQKDTVRLSRLSQKQALSDYNDKTAILLQIFQDRIAVKMSGGNYQLTGGRQMTLAGGSQGFAPDWIFALDADSGQSIGRIRLALEIEGTPFFKNWMKLHSIEKTVLSVDSKGLLKARQFQSLGHIILRDQPVPLSSVSSAQDAMLDIIRQKGLDVIFWPKSSQMLRNRLDYLFNAVGAPWPDVSDKTLLKKLDEWLGSFLPSLLTPDVLQKLELVKALKQLIPWNLVHTLDQAAPEYIQLPTGNRCILEYRADRVILRARIQQLFGMQSSPEIAGKPVETELLSPASRPLQITRDLSSFWQNTYAEVRKEMRGRYPKHYWPEDPSQAQATDKVRPRKK